MFTTAIRTKSLVALATAVAIVMLCGSNESTADPPRTALKPVPPMRSAPRSMHQEGRAEKAASRKLSWRASHKVMPEPEVPSPATRQPGIVDQKLTIPALGKAAKNLSERHGGSSESGRAIATSQRQGGKPSSLGAMIARTPSPRELRKGTNADDPAAISQVAFMQEIVTSGAGGNSGDGTLPPRIAMEPADPFKDPFGDFGSANVDSSARLINQEQDAAEGFSIPQLEGNGGLQMPTQPDASPAQLSPPNDPNLDSSETGNNPWKAGVEAGVEAGSTAPPLDSPSDRPGVVPPSLSVPLNDLSTGAEDDSSSAPQRDESAESGNDGSRAKLGEYTTTTCDELRQRLASRTIRDINLDISPPFRPAILEEDMFEERYKTFQENQLPRTWRNLAGETMVEGKFIGLEFENAVIEKVDGQQVEILLRRLSEPDLAYITEQWGLPPECQLPNVPYQPRQWLPITMTWKASALCHKPLYFEDVNLERYGHTTGPFAQPLISTAHFFVNIAVLPYKMGIHPPNECQYALGYYRPGNCAPWIIPPVPLSLRGALFQAGAVGAGIGLIP